MCAVDMLRRKKIIQFKMDMIGNERNRKVDYLWFETEKKKIKFIDNLIINPSSSNKYDIIIIIKDFENNNNSFYLCIKYIQRQGKEKSKIAFSWFYKIYFNYIEYSF